MSGTSRAGLELTAGHSYAGVSDATVFGGSLFIEAAINRALAIQGRLPLTFAFFDPDVGGDSSQAAIGDISLGLQGSTAHGSRRGARTILGGGLNLYLPTATDSGGAAVDATRKLYLPDSGRWMVDTTTLRFRGDIRVETGSFFFQSELDIDAHFSDPDDDLDLVADLGPGVMTSPNLAFLMELAISEITDDEQLTLDAGLRYHTHSLMLGARVYVPLSNAMRDNDVLGVGFDIGSRF